MGVTDGTPAKAGQQQAPGQLGQQPQGGKGRCRHQGMHARQRTEKTRRRRVVQRQQTGQRQHGQNGQWRRQAAIHVHGSKKPAKGAGQPGCGKDPALQRRLPPTDTCAQQKHQGRQRQDLPPPPRLPLHQTQPDQAGWHHHWPGQTGRLQHTGKQQHQPGHQGASSGLTHKQAKAWGLRQTHPAPVTP